MRTAGVREARQNLTDLLDDVELAQCRLARLDAEAAERDVEDMLWQVQHFEPGKQRMLFIFDCGEPEMFGAPN